MNALSHAIHDAHYAHYAASPTGLVQPSAQPNDNLIYHLYSTGEISYQKGGRAYLSRSEFMTEGRVSNYKKIGLKLPIALTDEISYAILRKEECDAFRARMCEEFV